MADLIENGDYVKAGNGLKSIEYIDEVLQNVKLVLNARRGKFYPNKDFGSLIKDNVNRSVEEYALAYARQAVDNMDGICVKNAVQNNDEMIFTILVNGEEGLVSIGIENNI